MHATVKRMFCAAMLIAALLSLFHATPSGAAGGEISDISAASSGLWRAVEERSFVAKGERLIVPEHYKT